MTWTRSTYWRITVPYWMSLTNPDGGGESLKKITLIGLDLAKAVFQIHGVDAQGNAVLRKRLGDFR
jgi:hypothetical protein